MREDIAVIESPSGAFAMLPEFVQGPVAYLLVKVASRCNIDCSYCYWFRDKSVYAKPKLMSSGVFTQLLKRIEEQITRFSLPEFSILLHGGEPLLWGVDNFQFFAEECRAISARTSCKFELSVTTNGLLIDDAWLDCFERYGFHVTVSIDGPAHIHDIHRRTFQNGPTHALVEGAIRRLQGRGVSIGVLAVCNPAYQPKEFLDYFAAMEIDSFDIMLPDATHEDNPPRVAQFYCDLFDLWLAANRDRKTINIRSTENMVAGLLGGSSTSEEIGYGPQEVCTILSDGAMEPLDVLRITGDGATNTNFDIFNNNIEDIKIEPRWKTAREASLNLSEKCKKCPFVEPCGGGYLPHRYSKKNGYNNPSAFCDDLFAIFTHMQSALEKHVYIKRSSGDKIGIGEAIAVEQQSQPQQPLNRLHAR